MRVLLLHSRYRSGPVSGENLVVADEARLLREGGHDVEVLSPEPDDRTAFSRTALGASAVWSRSATNEVRRRIARSRPDVVHVHNVLPTLSPAVIRAAAVEAPVVMTLHNYRLHCLPASLFRDGGICTDCVGHVPWRGVAHRCYRGSAVASAALAASLTLHRALRTFDDVRLFLAVSEFVRARHVAAGLDRSRIRTVRNFSWPSNPRVGAGSHFLFLGRLSDEKGVGTLLEAWRVLESPLVVAGDGPAARGMRAAATSAVRFVGPVTPEEGAALVAEARAVVLPSVWFEPASRVVAEAAASGVPAIASRIGGLAEMVSHDESGLLVRPGDPEDLAGAVRELMDDEVSVRLGAGAEREWRARYAPERAHDALIEAFRDAA